MSKILPQPGTYGARLNGQIVVRAEDSGALMAYIPYALCDSEVKFTGTHSLCLGSKDGTVQKKNISTLKDVFPDWDGLDPFGLEEIAVPEGSEPQFELADCFHDEYTPKVTDDNPDPQAVTTFKAQWFNKVGGGAPTKEPMSDAERKTVRTKWLGKFKAVSASTGSTKSSAAAPNKAPARPASGGPPSRNKPEPEAEARTATQVEVWAAFADANPKMKEADLGNKFWAAADKVVPDAKGELTEEQWGEVMTELGL